MDALPLLQFLSQSRKYTVVFAVLAAITFVLRQLGAAQDMPIAVMFTIYFVGGFCALLIIAEATLCLRSSFHRIQVAKASLASLTVQQRAILAYLKAHGARSFSDDNYAMLRELVSLGLLTSTTDQRSDEVQRATFTVPLYVWKRIHDPVWNAGPIPNGPPWTPQWVLENLGPASNFGRNRA